MADKNNEQEQNAVTQEEQKAAAQAEQNAGGYETKLSITAETQEKLEEMAQRAVEKAEQKRKELTFHGTEQSEKEYSQAEKRAKAAQFLHTAASGSFDELKQLNSEINQKAVNVSDDSTGGFLVPDVFESEVQATFDSYNEIISDADVQNFNRPGNTFKLNELDTRMDFYFTGEDSSGVTASTPTFTEPQIAIYKVLGTADITEDFMEDNETDILSLLSSIAGEGMAKKIQPRLLNDIVTESGVTLYGVGSKGNGATTVTMSASGGYTNITADDTRRAYFQAINLDHFQDANKDGKFYMNPLVMQEILEDVAANAGGQYSYSPFAAPAERLAGRPVVLTNQAGTPTTTTSEVVALYGNLNRHLKIRRKRGMTMKVNTSGTSLGGRNLNYQEGRELVFTQRIGHQTVLRDGLVHLVTK